MLKNMKRILIGTIASLVVLTVAFFVVGISALTISAYCFGVLGILVCFGSLWILSKEDKSRYIANVAISLISFRYLFFSLCISILFIILDKTDIWSIPIGYFILLQLFFAMILTLRLLAMGSGKEEIERVEKFVKAKTSDWLSLKQIIIEILNNSNEASKKDIITVHDAIRYADPIANENLKNYEAEIKTQLDELAISVKNGNDENTKRLCSHILKLIKNRNEQCKLLK